MLLIYTDGLTEAENEEREQHGEERLLELMNKEELYAQIINLIVY